jgi:uncharacterized protein (TIGR04255 family)
MLPGLQPDAFDEVIVAARKAGQTEGLADRVEFVEPLEITPSPEGVQRIRIGIDVGAFASPPRRVVFRRLDTAGATVRELSVSQKSLLVVEYSYTRWGQFFKLVTQLISSINQACPATQIVRATRLEYIDRFTSTTEDANHFEVLREDSPLLAAALRGKTNALHNHSGWFDFESGNIRRLTNVNVDVADVDIPAPPAPRRRISVLTLGQFEALHGEILDRPIERFDSLHDHLKALLASIISDEAVERIALNK